MPGHARLFWSFDKVSRARTVDAGADRASHETSQPPVAEGIGGLCI